MAKGTSRSIEIPVQESSGLEFIIQGLASRFENERLTKKDEEDRRFTLIAQLAQVGMIKFDPDAKKGDPGTITIGNTTYTIVDKPESILDQINSMKLKNQMFDDGILRPSDTRVNVEALQNSNAFLNTAAGQAQINQIRFLGATNQDSPVDIEKSVKVFTDAIELSETNKLLSIRELRFPTADKPSAEKVIKEGGDGNIEKKNKNLMDIIGDRIINFIPKDSKKLKFGGPQSKATFSDLLDTLTGVGTAQAAQPGTLGTQVTQAGVGGPGGTVGQGQVTPENQKPPLVDINPLGLIAGALGAVGIGVGQLGQAKGGFKEAQGLKSLLRSIKPGVGPTVAAGEKAGVKSALLNLARGGGAKGGGAARALVGGTALGALGTVAGIGTGIAVGDAALRSGVKLGGQTIPDLRAQRALDASQGVNPRINEQQSLGNLIPLLFPDVIGGIGEFGGQIAGLTGLIPQVPNEAESIRANQDAVRKNQELQRLLQQAQIPLSEQASRLQPQSNLGGLKNFDPNQLQDLSGLAGILR